RGGIKRLKVRTPTLANIIGLKRMLMGCEVADIPVVLASIDPCISCTNRVTIIDQRSPDVKVVSMEELRRLKLC
ncbi:MAG: hypothetical protein QXU67_03090, partial [Candidatus Bathyarchaeia archaeon]